MARSDREKAELCRDHIVAELPHWILHPEVVKKLRLRSVTLTPRVDTRLSRGNASWTGEVRVSTDLHRFRSASPYTVPRGKADISPAGVLSHELGHILDYALERNFGHKPISIRGLWTLLSLEKRKEAITSYARTCVEEDFAETHRLMLLNRVLLKELSRDRYAHMRFVYSALFGTMTPHRKYKLSKSEFEGQLEKLLRVQA